MADLTEARLTEISVVLGVLTTEPVKNYEQLHTAQAMWRAFGVSYGAELLAEVDRLNRQAADRLTTEGQLAEVKRLREQLSQQAADQLTEMDQWMETEAALRAEIATLTSERNRFRTAWKLARTRARSARCGADMYAARSQELQEALRETLINILVSQFKRAELAASNARLCDTLNFANRYIGELSKRRRR